MNLVLVGFMGSGKTAVGRRLAKRLGYHFLDTDRYIEDQTGLTVVQIFEHQGEAHFRELERRLAVNLYKVSNTVISTGGGMLFTPGNPESLKKAGPMVYLKAAEAAILERLGRNNNRPLASGEGWEDNIRQLLAQRSPLYETADLIIPTEDKSINQVAGEIIRHLGSLPNR